MSRARELASVQSWIRDFPKMRGTSIQPQEQGSYYEDTHKFAVNEPVFLLRGPPKTQTTGPTLGG